MSLNSSIPSAFVSRSDHATWMKLSTAKKLTSEKTMATYYCWLSVPAPNILDGQPKMLS